MSTFQEMMGEFMAMSLDNAIDSACGKSIYELTNFIFSPTFFLLSVNSPFSICVTCLAIISQMSHNQNCICSSLLQLFTLSNNYISVIKEFILRELFILKSISCIRCENCTQTNNTNSDSTLEFIDLR